MNKLMLVVLLTAAFLSPRAHSEDKYAHFPAVASQDLPTALCNINTYNEKLSELINKPILSAQDMVKVHELTYTLENAINFLKASLEQTSVDLEKVHKASEVLNQSIVKDTGKQYVKSTKLLSYPPTCSA